MTKHRRITGLIAVALIAIATAAAMRAHLPSKDDPTTSAGIMSFNERWGDSSKLATVHDDQSLVSSAKRN